MSMKRRTSTKACDAVKQVQLTSNMLSGHDDLQRAQVDYEKINYLMLMMVDPNVHFHVIPRYEGGREWQGREFVDVGWPKVPDLGHAVALEGESWPAAVCADDAAALPSGLPPAGLTRQRARRI